MCPRILTARLALFALALLLTAPACPAQETFRYEAAASIGMTGYAGDASSGWLFRSPGAAAALAFAWLPANRWAFRTSLGFAALRGSAAGLAETLPWVEACRFSTSCWQLDQRAELNFFPYGLGPSYTKTRPWTPYLSAGLGAALWATSGRTYAASVLPVGIGLKYKPAPRVNLAAEFSMTKVFSDRLDSPALDDPTAIKSSFIKNTDWIARFAVSVAWEFGKRCDACNYKD